MKKIIGTFAIICFVATTATANSNDVLIFENNQCLDYAFDVADSMHEQGYDGFACGAGFELAYDSCVAIFGDGENQ